MGKKLNMFTFSLSPRPPQIPAKTQDPKEQTKENLSYEAWDFLPEEKSLLQPPWLRHILSVCSSNHQSFEHLHIG